jgi:hypothetical protein
MNTKRNSLFFAVGVAAGLLVGGRSLMADEPAGAGPATVQVVASNDNAPAGDAKAPSKYWLGVQCEPASEFLREQLGLPKDQGLVVVRVVPRGPAGKADIRPNDLLLSASGTKLSAVADLAAAVDAAKEESLKLQLLRGGKTIDVAARPALRPENPEASLLQPGSDQETVERWLKQIGTNPPAAWANGITLVHPGAGLVLPPGVNVRPELPEDMSVDIHREGRKPAEITVKKGQDTWKATEDDLSKLPEDIRREVEPLLHDGPVRIWFRELQSSAAPGGASDANGGQSANADGERAKHQLEDLSRRMDDMRRTLQELRDREQSPQR